MLRDISSMTYESGLPTLKLFISKVQKLEESSFLSSLMNEFRLGFKFESGKAIKVSSFRPQQESIDAFVLTLRFFIQKNEPIAIKNLKTIFNSQLVTKKEKNRYELLRAELKNFWASSSKIVIRGDEPTNWDIFDTVIFGELSHSNKVKRERFEQWMSSLESTVIYSYQIMAMLNTLTYSTTVATTRLSQVL